MDVHELLTRRRSIRRFEARPVEDDVIDKLMGAVANAPSVGNMQPLSVVVVREAERLQIRSNAQFLFELRYPQYAMVRPNARLLRDLAAAGFSFDGLSRPKDD